MRNKFQLGQNQLQEEVRVFVESNNVATLCCAEYDTPHAFCCFYAFNDATQHLIFKSKPSSKHCDILSRNPRVSGTIVSAVAFILNNKGIQFEGTVIQPPVSDERLYYRKYPFALGIAGNVYTVCIDQVKFTATVGSQGRKHEWARD